MVIATSPLALLLATSAANQLVRALFDDTFAGIHHLDFFDLALLIPYFTVLVILSFYGCHRFEMIRKYLKHRPQATKPAMEPAARWTQLPRVTIQLPLYNERYVVERLIEEVCKMEYPRELLQIQVLDDSTDDTHPFTEALVRDYQAAGLPIEYLHRDNRAGFKAGALHAGMLTATGG
jgi:cellulose synthase/poly-beta-1,6-N-acetylglucosamine synthase-like glycosyltransferase